MIRLDVTQGLATRRAPRVVGGRRPHRARRRQRRRPARRARVGRARAHRLRRREVPPARPALDQRHGGRARRASASRSTTRNGREVAARGGRRRRARRGRARRARSPVTIAEDAEATRASSRCARSTSSARAESAIERDASRLRALYDAQKRIGAADGPERRARRHLRRRASRSCPGATHVTVVLREDDEDGRAGRRLRAHRHARARAAGPGDAAHPGHAQRLPQGGERARRGHRGRRAARGRRRPSRSWARRSAASLGVPLWRGEEILGVLQIDNRESAGVFTSADLDVMAVLGAPRLARGRERAPRAAAARGRGAAQEGERVPQDARGVAARRQGRAGDHRAQRRRCARSSSSSTRSSTRA